MCESKLLDRDTLATKIVLEIIDEFQLLLDREATDDRLKYGANGDVMLTNEAAIIDVDKHAHQELAIHSIRHAAMSWNAVSKVLDIESALETRSEKATKWCNQRSEACHGQQMELIRRIRNFVDFTRQDG